MLDLKNITNTWTLFLDRDGVINIEKHQDYIYHYGEFVFYEGVKEALRYLSTRFKRIIIITNQRGVGKELMTEEELINIHSQMVADVEAAGGRINKIYLTKQSQRLQEQTMELAEETLNEALHTVPTEKIEVCKEVLQIVYDNLK